MNINAAIIDQRITGLVEEIRDTARKDLQITDEEKLKSLAFLYFSVKTIFSIYNFSEEEIFDCITEGGEDFGVDAIHVSEEIDNEFTVSLFQVKYKRNLEGDFSFPEKGVKALVNAIRYIFDPSLELKNINNRLKIKVEDVRSLISDGFFPRIRAIACSNGINWNDSAQEEINRANLGGQVKFEYWNHDKFLQILQSAKSIDDTIQFSGEATVENFNYSSVFVGRISVEEVANLFKRHGEALLDKNIRKYLGLKGNRVNEDIRKTLISDDRINFYFYNNGVTFICDDFLYNNLQRMDYKVKVKNLQIINGGQTCMTIYKTLLEEDQALFKVSQEAFVLVRLYKIERGRNDENFIRKVTFATNNQNPVDLKDLKSNDDVQRRLEEDIKNLSFQYHRKRGDTPLKNTDITIGIAAEAILSILRERPNQAKFFAREHFGKLYDEIFNDSLRGAQVIAAVLLYRIAENKRKRPPAGTKDFIVYASCFLAMRMGKYLLRDLGCSNMAELDHRNFLKAKNLIEKNGEEYFRASIEDIDKALKELYGDREISMQQLSATFRRGDLISTLKAKV
ncbi:abortive infection phage resistance protein [Candidatus Omnitrophus magneticus]|uniref:Abortive infection phage resistance protein n=1 Tax=Candidatus Omnitrophus magneticus TaxID=1609969 RepID=A0A0F0CPB7_9BACT|nr:abortive infection phage resistance protein [Candidatus Omnitrophus magneticus]